MNREGVAEGVAVDASGRDRLIATYTTLGIAYFGLDWREARRIAIEIVAEKQEAAPTA